MSLSNNKFFYINSNFVHASNVLSNYINLTNINNLDSQETQLSKHARNLFFSPSCNKQFFDSINWANNLGIYKNQNLLLNPLVNNVFASPIRFYGGIFEDGASSTLSVNTNDTFNPFTYSTIPITAYDGSNQIDLDINNIEFRNAVAGNTVIPSSSVLYLETSFDILDSAIDGEARGDRFGFSTALNTNGTILAVGAVNNHDGGDKSGHVRVHQWIDNTWTQLGSDIPGEEQSDKFGFSLSLNSSGTILAAGAINNDGNENKSGHTRIFRLINGEWDQMGNDIDGGGADSKNGHSVSLSSNGLRVAVGEIRETARGIVNVYDWSEYQGKWNIVGSSINSTSTDGDRFGFSVSLSSNGNIVAIGAVGGVHGTGSTFGRVGVYELSGGSWTQMGTDITGEASGDQSGYSISLSSNGKIVAIGAPYNDNNSNTNAGYVRVYQWNNLSWVQLGDDINGAGSYDESGYSISLNSAGTRLVVGAPDNYYGSGVWPRKGDVRVYDWYDSSWMQIGNAIEGVWNNSYSGRSVSISRDGTRIAIAAIFTDASGELPTPYGPGNVTVYEIETRNTWKTAGTYYVRYKATDTHGNTTPNTAYYYLTVNVSD